MPVTDDELMPIGRFAHLSGLSVHALRHYDDVDLLSPADVDVRSGYRRYRRSQVPQARLISALRWIELPIDEIRHILQDANSADTILQRHRQRLMRQLDRLNARLGDVDRFIEEGLTVPHTQNGTRPVQIKIAVDDRRKAVEFYRQAFGMRYEVTRRTEEEDHSSFVVGRYGQPDFFLLHLIDDPTDADRPGPSTFGLLVDDLDDVHRRAIGAGATEVVAPRSPEGMPRSSAVRDPSGNWIWLYQG